MADKVTNQAGPADWQTAATWTPSGVPTAGNSVDITAGDTVTLSAPITQTAEVDIEGTLNTANQQATFNAEVNIAAEGQLLMGDPSDVALEGPVSLIVLNASVDLYGRLGAQVGGTIAIYYGVNPIIYFGGDASLTLHDGATLLNYSIDDQGNPSDAIWSFLVTGGGPTAWQFDAPGSSVTYRQYIAAPPIQTAYTQQYPWPDVAVDGMLGGIELDCYSVPVNCIVQPLFPPTAYCYRNGQLWDGPIQVTNGSDQLAAGGQYFFDLDFTVADSHGNHWQLGDHGTLKLFYAQYASDGRTVTWYETVYYWLVNKLGYETWEIVSKLQFDSDNAVQGTVIKGKVGVE